MKQHKHIWGWTATTRERESFKTECQSITWKQCSSIGQKYADEKAVAAAEVLGDAEEAAEEAILEPYYEVEAVAENVLIDLILRDASI